MYVNTMLLPATSRRRVPMCAGIAEPTAVVTGARGMTLSTAGFAAASHAAIRTQSVTPFTDQVAAAAANGVTAGLRTRRRPPA